MGELQRCIGSLDTQILVDVVSGQLDLNELAALELQRRSGVKAQLELEFDDLPLLLQPQAG
jgi:hypothetical protein